MQLGNFMIKPLSKNTFESNVGRGEGGGGRSCLSFLLYF